MPLVMECLIIRPKASGQHIFMRMNGQFYVGQLNFQVGTLSTATDAAKFNITHSGALEPADIDATLAEIDRFTDANGNSLLKYPQTLTIYQGMAVAPPSLSLLPTPYGM